ncbi:hypothetical protein E2C01_085140 [Portunus trituberculatus]|uniref:Uncharacterized protein n=1 Tax=Portunus trituberculatus TaxID=210409 RepID=A0A5B7J9M9_PORTR|nr:hypothetical protein [Portunus trituberculatus]
MSTYYFFIIIIFFFFNQSGCVEGAPYPIRHVRASCPLWRHTGLPHCFNEEYSLNKLCPQAAFMSGLTIIRLESFRCGNPLHLQ